MKIIIIGGVAGGATTAARIRRVDETAEIILLEKGKYISYANCGLPYYIGNVITDREKLFVQTPEAFSVRFRIDVRTENEVIFIDRKKKKVTVRLNNEDTYEEGYDKLLISTGAIPVRPPLPVMQVEQAYAPPFSSAKDPVAIAGYVAENIIAEKVKPVYWRDLRDTRPGDELLLDVRTPDEFSLGSLPGAVNIPLDEIRDRIDEIPKDKPVYVFCAVGLRGYLAYRILSQHGYGKVRNLSGGLKTYKAATAPIVLNEGNENQHTGNEATSTTFTPALQTTAESGSPARVIRVDACGMQCPGPILK